MRSSLRVLLFGLLAAALAAQQAEALRVLAFGDAGDPVERFRTARSAEQWVAICSGESLPERVTKIAVDHGKEVLVVLWYGRGRSGAPQVGLLCSAPERPNRLVRLAGAAGSPPVDGRWVVFAVPIGWEPWRETTWFETDAPPVAGRPRWRGVLSGRAPFVMAPVGTVVGDPGAAVVCLGDVVALRQFWREHAPRVRVPDYDFAQVIVLVVAGFDRSLYTMSGVEPGPGENGARSTSCTVVRRWQKDEARERGGPAAAAQFGWYVMPRLSGVLDFEVPVDAAADIARDTVQVLERFTIPPPATSPKLPVLRAVEGEAASRRDTLCVRATTAAEWKALRAETGGPVAALPDDWADFEHQQVVVIVAAAARMEPGFGMQVTEEEGVDVLTLQQSGPSGRDPGERSFVTAIKLPRRRGQLSVVLQRTAGPGPVDEQTLRVFPGF